MYEDLRSRLDQLRPFMRAELEHLVRIPSVSAPGFDPDGVVSSAEAVAALLEEAGLRDVRLLRLDRAHPAVLGEIPSPAGAPTVLLYAHHDVQPPGDLSTWDMPPFEPFERDGRLFGRGTADDKCGIVMHAAALRALGDACPVGVKVFVEGEEEIGSLHLPGFLARYHHLLEADHIVIGDSGNPRVGRPAFTTSLRGLVDCIVEVRTLRHAVHSGEWGGAIPDALTCLVRTLATLHDDEGNVAVPGLVTSSGGDGGPTEEEVRRQAEVVPTVRLLGEGTVADRLWHRPAATVLALDAPPVQEAVNALIPVARAKVGLRIAPGDDPARAMEALVAHLEHNVPWGAEVTVTPGARGDAFSLAASGPAYAAYREGFREAWGVDPVEVGVGGSIPFVAALSESFPAASIVLTGSSDPTSRIHGPNESVDLAELFRSTLAEAIALRTLGG